MHSSGCNVLTFEKSFVRQKNTVNYFIFDDDKKATFESIFGVKSSGLCRAAAVEALQEKYTDRRFIRKSTCIFRASESCWLYEGNYIDGRRRKLKLFAREEMIVWLSAMRRSFKDHNSKSVQ